VVRLYVGNAALILPVERVDELRYVNVDRSIIILPSCALVPVCLLFARESGGFRLLLTSSTSSGRHSCWVRETSRPHHDAYGRQKEWLGREKERKSWREGKEGTGAGWTGDISIICQM
jgi:hypothetical protein